MSKSQKLSHVVCTFNSSSLIPPYPHCDHLDNSPTPHFFLHKPPNHHHRYLHLSSTLHQVKTHNYPSPINHYHNHYHLQPPETSPHAPPWKKTKTTPPSSPYPCQGTTASTYLTSSLRIEPQNSPTIIAIYNDLHSNPQRTILREMKVGVKLRC